MFFKSENIYRFSIITLGISCIITQIILLREFLTVFFGNELVMGIILANWMLLTGLGSYLGKYFDNIKNKSSYIILFQVLIGILPIITVFLLKFLRDIVFPIGSMTSLIDVLFSSFVLLFPYCILSGLLFTLFCTIVSQIIKTNYISKVYALEAIGSITGGLIFNFIFLYFFTTFLSLTFLLIINLIAAFCLSISEKKFFAKYFILFIFIISIIILFKFNLDDISTKLLFKNQQILFQKDTPYGNLVVTQTGEQINFFENGVSLFSTDNIIENEEAIHYAMVQHTDPKKVLLISGGISGTINEILKYNVNEIDYVEINPWLIDIGKKYARALDLDNEKINIINKDARLFVKKTTNLYDVVLINLPEPTSAQINRYYTVNFFRQ
ncbi:MAG: fused MFS/spermidine synthase, partial [Bacteroidales bacterium]|nr:fused MFS/spermidine synthase [Bacteroidales bacterium]